MHFAIVLPQQVSKYRTKIVCGLYQTTNVLIIELLDAVVSIIITAPVVLGKRCSSLNTQVNADMGVAMDF